MSLLGIGGSRSSSSSRSDSSSFDNLDQFGFNVGVQGSTNVSGSQSGGTSRDSIAFEDLFAQLFGGASAAAAGINTGGLTSAANSLFSSGGGFLDSLSGGGAGGDYLRERVAGGDRLASEQIDLLGGDIQKFLNESVLPGIKSSGISASTFGGSRGDVAKGIAGEGALREFSRGAQSIRQDQQNSLDTIAQALLSSNNQAANIGLGSLEGLFGLAQGGALADLSPFMALAEILGGPTVLNESNNQATSSALAESFGFDIGSDTTTGRAGSQSTSRSRSSSSSFNLGF